MVMNLAVATGTGSALLSALNATAVVSTTIKTIQNANGTNETMFGQSFAINENETITSHAFSTNETDDLGLYDFLDYTDMEHFFKYVDFPKEKYVQRSLSEAIVKIVVYSLIIILSFVGNVLIILVVVWNKRLRTTTNYYIVNLAVADLLVTLSCSWVHLVDDLTTGWVLGSFFCKFNSFAQVTSLVSSVMTLSLIACDRFFGIVYAMKALIMERRACHTIVVIWVVSIALATPMLVYQTTGQRQWQDFMERWCGGDWPVAEKVTEDGRTISYQPGRLTYLTCITVIMFLIPMVVMSAAYCGVIKTLWEAKVPGERVTNDVTVQNKVKRKVVLMLILIMVVFCVCWLPLQFTIIYAEYRPDKSEELGEWYMKFRFFAKMLAYSNSAMNPLIYAGFNDNFRKGFKLLFGCYKRKRYETLSKLDETSHSHTTMLSSATMTTNITRM